MTALTQVVTKLHVRLYRAFDGRFVSRGPGGVPLLLLTTTGRRSGQSRTVPVGYVRHGDDLLISPGSSSAPAPGWLRNLETGPEARVQLRHQHLTASADVPDGAEQRALWRKMVAARPIYRLGERSPQARRSPVVVRLRVHQSTHRPSDVRRRPS